MKRTISIFFAFLMVISLYQSTSVLAIDGSLDLGTEEVELVNDNVYKKIHFYLDVDEYTTIDSREELVTATNYAVKNYAVEQYEQASARGEQFNSYQVTVEFASDFMSTDTYKELMKERETLGTISAVRDFRSRLNSFSKEYHTQLVSKSMKSVEGLEYSEADPVAYSPFVILETPINNVTVDALVDVATQGNVMNISVSTEVNELPPIENPFDDTNPSVDPNSWENMLRDINAYNIVTNGTLTGEGIRIGIFEGSGVCNKTIQGLSDKDITTYEGHGTDSHADLVTLIAAQIAPDAKYFVSKKISGQWLEWFIENDCDVVNYSGGLDTNMYAFDRDAIIDYQVKAHNIVFVKSAGNRGEVTTNIEITSPGYAFNAITVGGVNKDSLGNLTHDPKSCYASDYPENKPNVVAKNTIVSLPYYYGRTILSGTSVAAPQVTGCIALLMQNNSRLIAKPEIIMSLIASCARETDDYSAETNTSLDDKVGAGIIDLGRMINHSYHSIYNTTGEYGDIIFSRDVYLNAGDEIQIALAWLAGTNGVETGNGITVSETYVNDYDLDLFYNNSNWTSGGAVEAQSSCMDSNVEMIRCTVVVSGTYTIRVKQYDDILPGMDGDDIALTYNIE